jgi:hypothetical protein
MKVVDREGSVREVSNLGEITQIPYIPHLAFDSFKTLRSVVRKNRALGKAKAFTTRQLWLGSYFQKEVLGEISPPVSLRYVSDDIGWGIFAEKEFQAMEFIAEYSGIFRRRRRNDSTNAYCFECPFIRGEESSYLIDAKFQGGISRYINHSDEPNLESALATVCGMPHIILYTTQRIEKGAELCYDYGTDYWKKRKKRVALVDAP